MLSRPGRGATALVLALAMSWSTVGLAAPPEDAGETDDLGAMWREAQTRMGTADYPGAVEVLTELYRQIATDPEALALRLRVRWTLHEAHFKTYERDKAIEHLEICEDLLEGYLAELPEGEDRQPAETALAEVRSEREKAEAAAAAAEAKQAEEKAEEAPAEEEIADEPVVEQKPHKPLVIAGGTLLGVGVAAGVVSVVGFAMANTAVDTFETDYERRDEARGDAQTGNALGTAMAITGGLLVVTGVALLAVGLTRKKKATMAALPSFSLVAGRGGASFAVGGRF